MGLWSAVFGMNVVVALIMLMLFVTSIYFATTDDNKGFKMYSAVYIGPNEAPIKENSFGPRTLYALLASFTAVTFIFHVIYASLGSRYKQMVLRGNNWLRWIEYSISASIMIAIIALSSGVSELLLQVLIPLVVIGVMALGDVVEKLLMLQASGKADVRAPTLVATSAAWLLMLSAYGMILANFAEVVKVSDTPPPKPVYGAVIGLFILYILFGIAQGADVGRTLWTGKRGEKECKQVELTYTALSVTSKVLLVGLLLGGVTGRASAGNEEVERQ
jgi:hypothetical protein